MLNEILRSLRNRSFVIDSFEKADAACRKERAHRPLEQLPLPIWLWSRGFVICEEQVADQGEDFCLAVRKQERILVGVFDGCGGSGARVYTALGNRTGAYVASRALAVSVRKWFYQPYSDGKNKKLKEFIACK